MRFGWLFLSLSPSPEEDAQRIYQQIEQVRFAERLGFGDVWLTEHYFTGESVYQRPAAVRLCCRDAHREDPDRLRRRAAALPPPGAARCPACAARQSEQGPDRCRSRQGHDLQ